MRTSQVRALVATTLCAWHHVVGRVVEQALLPTQPACVFLT